MVSKWRFSLAALAIAACLPELSALPPAVDASLPPPVPPSMCGDGVIDPGEACDPGDAGAEAGVIGCRDCQVECPDGQLTPSGHCYFALPASTSFADAEARCRAQRAHVVTLGSQEEVAVVARVTANPYWVGLSFAPVAGNFTASPSPQEPGYPARGNGPCAGCFGFGLPEGGVPVFFDGGGVFLPEECVVGRGAAWIGERCATAASPRDTVCEREPRGRRYQACNGGLCFTLPVTATKKSYLVILARESAEVAKATCQGVPGGHLVVLESAEERAAVVRELDAMVPADSGEVREFWVGLHASGGVWSWETPAGMQPPPWADRQPSAEPDAYLSLDFKYDTSLVHAAAPGASRAYVCELPIAN